MGYNYNNKMENSNLQQKEKQIKKDILNASFDAKACHISSALSCVGIMVDLFYNRLKDDDIFLFSKASGVATYYAILADKGIIKKEDLATTLKHFPLASKEVPGVIHSVGSLGHGLPVAVGIAYAQLDKQVYVLISDAECQEGTFWESMLFKANHYLDNLHIIVDNNHFQACGKTEKILSIPWNFVRSIGVEVVETKKGDGVSFMEGDYSWHYRNLTELELLEALKQIDG